MIKTLTPAGVPIGNSRKLKLRALARDALQQRDLLLCDTCDRPRHRSNDRIRIVR